MATIATALGFGLLLLITGLSIGISLAMPWLVLAGVVAAGVWCGRILDTRYKKKIFFAMIPILLVVLPLLWSVGNYKKFESLCAKEPPVTPILKSPRPQPGFLVDDLGLHAFHSGKFIRTPELLLESKQIAYYDEIFSTADNNFQPKAYRRSKVSNSNIAEPPSEFVFKVSEVEPVDGLWYSPIYRLSYSVQSTSGSPTLAKRFEYVFGGGLVGFYMHALLGTRGDYSDRDFSHLSCGYASTAPAAWRPRFSTNPNSENYSRADIELLSSIVY